MFAIDRAGLVGADGPTHHGMFDIAYMRMIPHMRVIAPSNEVELVSALHTALELGGPVAVRYPRSSVQGLELPDQPEIMPYGKGDIRRDGEDIAILAFGSMVQTALKATRRSTSSRAASPTHSPTASTLTGASHSTRSASPSTSCAPSTRSS